MAVPAPAPPPFDLKNIQGDILAGSLPKRTETFLFFTIDQSHVKDFRAQLAQLVPLITTTAQVVKNRTDIIQSKEDAAAKKTPQPLLKMVGVNISFSHKGLAVLGIKDEIGDSAFDQGMLNDASNLGDAGTGTGPDFKPNWVPAFKHDIHGVILVAGDCHATIDHKLGEIKRIFKVGSHNASIHDVKEIRGDVRPDKEKGHEHFGFLDGVSQPAVTGVEKTTFPGQDFVPQGTILLGREGDKPSPIPPATTPVTRPAWALDGSFLTFRYLFQLVPEFDNFLKANPIDGVLPRELGSELLGARMVGRWKSGAPIDLFPTADNPDAGGDPQKNDNFDFAFTNPDDATTQTRCPFAAHIRKTYPRNDLEGPPFNLDIDNRRIIRAGIPFGPEVTDDERKRGKTEHGRGLLFVCYQSNIEDGFQFIQKSWANTPSFPPKGNPIGSLQSGFDPIIGQGPSPRSVIGMNPQAQDASLSLPAEWVLPRGGEYFFSPSLPTLKGVFAQVEGTHANGHGEL